MSGSGTGRTKRKRSVYNDKLIRAGESSLRYHFRGMYDDLKAIATLEFAKEAERLAVERANKLGSVRHGPPGGLTQRRVLEVELEHAREIAEAYAKIWLNLLEERNSGVLTRQHVDFITEEVRNLTASKKASLLNGPNPVRLASAGQQIATEIDRIVASIRRDLEIRIRRQEAGLRKESLSKDRIHIEIKNAANVNLGSQVGEIKAALNVVADQSHAHRDFSAAVREVSDAILKSEQIKDADKQQALQVISELVNQAQCKPEERSSGVLNALIAGFPKIVGVAADVTTLWANYVPMIRAFFGI